MLDLSGQTLLRAGTVIKQILFPSYFVAYQNDDTDKWEVETMNFVSDDNYNTALMRAACKASIRLNLNYVVIGQFKRGEAFIYDVYQNEDFDNCKRLVRIGDNGMIGVSTPCASAVSDFFTK